MRNWTIKPGTLLVLIGLLTVILLVLVLPQVDLLDTAFQRGTSPVTVHSEATAAPIVLKAGVAANSLVSVRSWEALKVESAHPSGSAAPNFLPILLRSIRC
jgi:hypothetical protein